MTQNNQHQNAETRASKAKTTQALSQAVDASQPIIKSTSHASAVLNELLFKSQNRKAELETIITALQLELSEEIQVIDATDAALAVLEQRNHPRFVEKAPTNEGLVRGEET